MGTADSIFLCAFDRAIFLVNAYNARITIGHQFIESQADYEQLRELFQLYLPRDTNFFHEHHALLVKLGKDFCRPKAGRADCLLNKPPHNFDIE